MSSSQYIAALQVGQYRFWFAHWDVPEFGHVPIAAQMQEEEIKAGGTDGVRYVDDHKEYAEFTANTLEDTTSYAAAVALAGQYEVCKSYISQLAVIVSGQNNVYKTVHIVDVKAQSVAGGLTGYGASSGSAAVVRALWKFRVLALP